MILVDINVPDKCIRCPMSCKIPKVPTSTDFDGGFYEYICRVDYKEHTPMDDTCPIKAEIPDNATNYDYECSECGHDVIDKTPYCSDCGANMESEDISQQLKAVKVTKMKEDDFDNLDSMLEDLWNDTESEDKE